LPYCFHFNVLVLKTKTGKTPFLRQCIFISKSSCFPLVCPFLSLHLCVTKLVCYSSKNVVEPSLKTKTEQDRLPINEPKNNEETVGAPENPKQSRDNQKICMK